MKNWTGIFFVWLGTSLVALNQPLYIISDVQTSDRIYAIPFFFFFFASFYLYILHFFYKTNSTHSIFRTIEALASLPQQIIKITTT